MVFATIDSYNDNPSWQNFSEDTEMHNDEIEIRHG